MFDLLRSRHRHESSDAITAQILRETLGQCPRCRQPFIGHEYRLLASTTLKEGQLQDFAALLAAIRNQDWLKAMAYQVWQGDQTNAEVYGIRCSNEEISVVVISAPFALDEPYVLMHKQTVDDASVFWASLAGEDGWHSFSQ